METGSSRPRWLDPELAAILVLLPQFDITELDTARATELRIVSQATTAAPEIVVEDAVVTGRSGVAIPVRVYRPPGAGEDLPAVVFIHGGGFMLGGVHSEDERCRLYAKLTNCVVVGLTYRLAPEHPFPAAYEDSADVVDWVFAKAEQLGIDDTRIAIGGDSSGGGLAASIAVARVSRPPIVHQILINPVLDPSSSSYSATTFVDTPVWNRQSNLLMWERYLDPAGEVPDARASPLFAADLTDAPPASFWVAELDPVRDEGIDYAARLMRSGVQVELHQYLGTFHGFDNYRMTRIGQRALADQVSALQRAFSH